MKHMQRIAEKLNQLKEKDKKHNIFGSDSHKYKLNPVLNEAEIKEYEERNKLTLPEDYRWFLLNIGNGGAGPHYGLYELFDPRDTNEYPFVYGQMFSLIENEENDGDENDEDYPVSSCRENIVYKKSQQGTIEICNEGCGMEIMLVLKGKEKGAVWFTDFGNEAGLFPIESQVNPGTSMTFAEWYEAWLDAALTGKSFDAKSFINDKGLTQIEVTEEEIEIERESDEDEESKDCDEAAISHTIGNAWDNILKKEFEADYFKKLEAFLKDEYATKTIYPKQENIFNTFKFTAPEKVRVVILGQDPYINEGQAHGFALSVLPGITPPPSLKNMYKELESDLGIPVSKSGHLIKWAEQGILLLNTVLTVEASKSNSHAKKGWEKFTDAVFAYLGASEQPIVFMLWGKPAQAKEKFITGKNHCIIKSPHPSPLSASTGFFGSKPYSQANAFLKEKGLKEINWRVE